MRTYETMPQPLTHAEADAAATAAAEYRAWKVERDARKAAWREFWRPIGLPAMPLLRGMYDIVLAHSETRMPKWKFRLVDDLIVEVQPKLRRSSRLFAVAALCCGSLDLATFIRPRADLGRQRAWNDLTARLTMPNDTEAALQCRHVGWQRGTSGPATPDRSAPCRTGCSAY